MKSLGTVAQVVPELHIVKEMGVAIYDIHGYHVFRQWKSTQLQLRLVADTTVTTQPTQGETENQFILDKLRPPAKSDLARKCKVEKPKAPTAQTKKSKLLY